MKRSRGRDGDMINGALRSRPWRGCARDSIEGTSAARRDGCDRLPPERELGARARRRPPLAAPRAGRAGETRAGSRATRARGTFVTMDGRRADRPAALDQHPRAHQPARGHGGAAGARAAGGAAGGGARLAMRHRQAGRALAARDRGGQGRRRPTSAPTPLFHRTHRRRPSATRCCWRCSTR